MNKFINVICIITALLQMQSCKKKLVPTGDDGTIEFKIDGTFDGKKVLLEAGRNHYYMHTDYYTDTSNIINCEGQLGWLTDKDNHDYFKIIFKNYTASNNPNVDVLLESKDYKSYQPILQASKTIIGKAVQFTFTGNDQNVGSYLWFFGDGDSSTEKNPYHVYKIAGQMSVGCLVKYNNQIQDFLQNTIDVTNGKNCNAQFTVQRIIGSDSIIATAINHSNTNIWQLPNGSTASGNTIYYTTPIALRSYITMQDNSNCNTVFRQVVSPKNTLALCNFNYSTKDTTYVQLLPPANNFGTVIMEYFREGKKYVSYKANGSNSDKNVFKITNKYLYQKNTQGMRTAKIVGEVATYFYNEANNTDSIYVQSNNVQLAVAYP
jgi:PKD repeat protein